LTDDYANSEDPRALTLLKQLEPHSAQLAKDANDVSSQAMLLLNQQVLYAGRPRSGVLQKQYERVVYKTYHPNEGRWADGNNFHDQVWLWQWHVHQGMLPVNQQISLR